MSARRMTCRNVPIVKKETVVRLKLLLFPSVRDVGTLDDDVYPFSDHATHGEDDWDVVSVEGELEVTH